MKKLLVLMVAFLIMFSFTVSIAETRIDPSAKRGIVPQGRNAAGTFDNNPVIAGESMTTGLPGDGTYVPFLVNIDNVAGAWPQWGIGQADIIYEMPIHGLSLTRLMALFTHDHPAGVGPLRSGRVMHAEMREEWDAAWAFAGVQNAEGSSVYATLRKLGARDKEVDLLFDVNTGKWGSMTTNLKHHEAPHNHSFHLAEAAAMVAEYDFPKRPFLFTDEIPAAGHPAASIRMLYGGGDEGSYTNSGYTYDAETNLYTRYRKNKPYEDMDNPGVALTFSNVIVQWTDLKFNGGASLPLLKEVGEGNADIFTGGKHIAGYWVRESVTSRTIFFDADGNEIRLQRGKTWINITTDRSTTVVYE